MKFLIFVSLIAIVTSLPTPDIDQVLKNIQQNINKHGIYHNTFEEEIKQEQIIENAQLIDGVYVDTQAISTVKQIMTHYLKNHPQPVQHVPINRKLAVIESNDEDEIINKRSCGRDSPITEYTREEIKKAKKWESYLNDNTNELSTFFYVVSEAQNQTILVPRNNNEILLIFPGPTTKIARLFAGFDFTYEGNVYHSTKSLSKSITDVIYDSVKTDEIEEVQRISNCMSLTLDTFAYFRFNQNFEQHPIGLTEMKFIYAKYDIYQNLQACIRCLCIYKKVCEVTNAEDTDVIENKIFPTYYTVIGNIKKKAVPIIKPVDKDAAEILAPITENLKNATFMQKYNEEASVRVARHILPDNENTTTEINNESTTTEINNENEINTTESNNEINTTESNNENESTTTEINTTESPTTFKPTPNITKEDRTVLIAITTESPTTTTNTTTLEEDTPLVHLILSSEKNDSTTIPYALSEDTLALKVSTDKNIIDQSTNYYNYDDYEEEEEKEVDNVWYSNRLVIFFGTLIGLLFIGFIFKIIHHCLKEKRAYQMDIALEEHASRNLPTDFI